MRLIGPSKASPIILLIIVLVLSASGIAGEPNQQNVLDQLNSSLKELTDRVAPAVVDIQAFGYSTDDEDYENARTVVKQHVSGSGVILESDGYVITNAHVLSGAQRIRVTLNPARKTELRSRSIEGQGSSFDAKIIGVHQETDLAVLKVNAWSLPTLQFASYDNLRQGQIVIAVGSPFGMRNTATMGIVSSVARQIEPDGPVAYIQTDAGLNPGNSGGALVDTAGYLVGINTGIIDGDRIGLAIPSDTVKFIYEQIRNFGRVRQGEIGIGVQTITPTMAAGLGLTRNSGIIVADVRPGSPAEASGIQPEDIIVTADGKPVGSTPDLATLSYRKKPGDYVSLELLRHNARVVLRVPMVEKKSETDSIRVAEPDQSLISTLGIVGISISNEIAETMPGMRVPSGVLVTGVSTRGEAADAPLKVNDVIHAVNGIAVKNMSDIRTALAKLSPGSAVVLRIERQKRFLYLASEVN
jgi:serine protease Do